MKHNIARLRPKKYIKQEKAVPRIDVDLFAQSSSQKLNILQNAFNELKGDEPRVTSIESYYDDDGKDRILNIEIASLGNYTFKVIHSDQVLYLLSPISGVNKYCFDEGESRWVCNKDSHILDELLVRETIGNTKGYLKL